MMEDKRTDELEDETLAEELDAAPAEPVVEDATPRRNRARREPRPENREETRDYGGEAYSRVREVLETSNAWNAFMSDEKIGQYVRYTPEGVEAVPETPPVVRAMLYNAATAILHANDVRYDAQHEMPFYVREATD